MKKILPIMLVMVLIVSGCSPKGSNQNIVIDFPVDARCTSIVNKVNDYLENKYDNSRESGSYFALMNIFYSEGDGKCLYAFNASSDFYVSEPKSREQILWYLINDSETNENIWTSGKISFSKDKMDYLNEKKKEFLDKIDYLKNRGLNFYKDTEFNVSFKYPLDWQLLEGDSNKHAVNLISSPQENIYFDYESKSTTEYEEELKKGLGDAFSTRKIYFLDNSKYPATEFSMHGGRSFIIEIADKFLLINTEFELTDNQKEGLKIILDSLSL